MSDPSPPSPPPKRRDRPKWYQVWDQPLAALVGGIGGWLMYVTMHDDPKGMAAVGGFFVYIAASVVLKRR